jgi:hypothetical protein
MNSDDSAAVAALEGGKEEEEEEEEEGAGEPTTRRSRLRDTLCTDSKLLVAAISSTMVFAIAGFCVSIARVMAADDELARKFLQHVATTYYESNEDNNGSEYM